MSKKQTLGANTEFDEIDKNYLPADTEFDEVDSPVKKKEPTTTGSENPATPSYKLGETLEERQAAVAGHAAFIGNKPTTGRKVKDYVDINPKMDIVSQTDVIQTPTATSLETQKVNVKDIYRGKTADKYNFDEINRNAGFNPEVEKEAYGALVNDYLEYLSNTDENKFKDTDAAWKELSAQKEKGELSSGQESRMKSIVESAANLRNDSAIEKAKIVSETPEFRSFLRKAAILDAKGATAEEYEKAKEESGLTPEMEAVYESAQNEYIKPFGVEHKLTKDFPNASATEQTARMNEADRRQAAMQGKTEFIDTFINGVGNMAMNIAQLPKTVSDTFGATDYTMVDELYDKVQGGKNKLNSETGAIDSEGLPLKYKLTQVAGQASASMAMFMAGGAGALSRAGQAFNTGAVAFATSQPDYYREAIAMGKSPKQASLDADFLALNQAVIESAIPDIQFLEGSSGFAKTLKEAYKSGKTAQESLVLAMKALPKAAQDKVAELAKKGTKEGIIEEGGAQAAEDVIKTGINQVSDSQYEVGNAMDYVDGILGGFMATTGASLFSSSAPKPDETKAIMMDAVLNRDEIVSDMEAVDPEKAKEVKETLDSAAENLDALSSHSGWEELSNKEKADAFDATQRMKALEDENKAIAGVRLVDAKKEEQIKAIEEELNKIFETKPSNTKEVLEEIKKGEDGIVETETEVETERLPTEQKAEGENINQEQAVEPSASGETTETTEVKTEPVKEAGEGVKPIKVFHGTSQNIDKPTLDKYGKVHEGGGMLGKAIYFTPNKKDAEYFADLSLNKNEGGKKKIIEGNLSPKKMISVTELVKTASDEVIQKWLEESGKTFSTVENVRSKVDVKTNEKELTNSIGMFGDISRLAELNGNDAVYWGNGDNIKEIAVIDENLFSNEPTPNLPQSSGDTSIIEGVPASDLSQSGQNDVSKTGEKIDIEKGRVDQVKQRVTDAGEKIKAKLKAKSPLAKDAKQAGFGFDTDDLIDAAVKLIHAGIDAGVAIKKHVTESKWYQSLSDDEKSIVDQIVEASETEEETNQPESETEQKPKGEVKERGFIKQVRDSKDISDETKAAFTEEGINYEVLPNEISSGEAKALVDAIGEEEAHKMVISPSKKLKGAVRVMMAQMLIKKYNEAGDYQKAVELVEDLAETGTEAGQTAQAFSVFKYLTPDGQLLMAQREAARQRAKQLKRPVHKNRVKKLKKAIDTANKEAVDETIKNVTGRIKETVVSTPKVSRPASYGSKNKIISKQKYEEARKALKTKMFSTVVPPPELVTIAAYHIEAGARDFAEFSKRMIEDFGDKVKDYLEGAYDAANLELESQEKEQSIADLAKQFSALLSQRIPSDKARKTKEEKLAELAKKLDEQTDSNDYSKLVEEYEKITDAEKKKRQAEVAAREAERKAARAVVAAEKLAQRQAQAAAKKRQAAIDKAGSQTGVKEGLKDLDIRIQELIRSHYTEVGEAGRSLAEKLVSDLGLSGQEAKNLEKIVGQEFGRLVAEKKRNAIKAIFNRKNRKKAEVKQLEDKLVELSNLGAISEAALSEAYADAMGFAKITPQNAKEIKALAEKVQSAKTERDKGRAVEDLLKYQERIKGFSNGEMLQAYWMAAILSGPKTQAVNILANLYNMVSLYSDVVLQNPKSARFVTKGLVVGLKKGFFEGADALRTGYAPIRGKIDVPNILEREKFVGGNVNPANQAKYVRRVMLAADTLFFEGLRQMRSFQMARKMAMEESESDPSINVKNRALEILGRDGLNDAIDQAAEERDEAIANIESSDLSDKEKKAAIKQIKIDERFRIHELIEKDRPHDIATEAHDYAVRGTFNSKPDGILGVLSDNMNNISRKIPAMKYVVPFVNVISNVANNLIENTPLGFVGAVRGSGGITNINGREMTTQQRADAYTKALKGTILMLGVYLLTQSWGDDDEPFLEVTSNGYGDYAKNAQLMAQGWRPYSFRYKKSDGTYSDWISYKDTPFMLGLSYIGNRNDFEKYRKEKFNDEWHTKEAVAATGVARSFFDATFLSSGESFLNTLLESKNERLDDDISEWVNKTVSSAVMPNLVSQSSQIIGDWMNVPDKEIKDTYLGRVLKNIPIARDQYFDKINGLGEPITQQADMVVSINESGESDKLWQLLVDNKASTGALNRNSVHPFDESIGKERVLTDEEFYNFSRIKGSIQKKALEDNYTVASQMTPEQFNKWFDKVKSRATTVAKVYFDSGIPKDADVNEWMKENIEPVKVFMVIPERDVNSIIDIEKEFRNDATEQLYK